MFGVLAAVLISVYADGGGGVEDDVLRVAKGKAKGVVRVVVISPLPNIVTWKRGTLAWHKYSALWEDCNVLAAEGIAKRNVQYVR